MGVLKLMFEDRTHENLKNEILNSYNLDIAKNEGTFLNEIASGSALAHASIYSVLEKLLNIAFIKDSYGDSLDKRVKEFGIERKEGMQAVGMVKFYGQVGVEIGSGVIIIANGNRYEVLDNQNGRIESEDGVELYIRSLEVGADKNLLTDNLFILGTTLSGIERIESVSSITGGTNPESDDELKERFFYIQAHKGTSGNVDDYINWALQVDGVKNVKVIPLWNGNGTVKVVVMTKNNRNVSEEVVQATKEYIESKRPIGANVTVTTPRVLDIQISAKVEHEKYVDLDSIKAQFRDYVDEYLVNAVSEITYTKIAGILSKIDGVIDYSNLTINNGTRNIKLVTDQVGSVGTITLTEGVID